MQTEVQNELEILKNRIVDNFHPIKIILFGSQATGLADSNSDIDICIIFSEKIESKRDLSIKILSLAKDLKTGIDCIVGTDDDINNSIQRKHTIYYRISREGKVIYESK